MFLPMRKAQGAPTAPYQVGMCNFNVTQKYLYTGGSKNGKE